MGFPAKYGGVFLDDFQFVTDPGIYEPLNWVKRYSVKRCGGKSLSIQDWGTWMADNTLRLGSGTNLSGAPQILDGEDVAALSELYQRQGETFTLTDWLQNEFTIHLVEFLPPFFAAGQFWKYEMKLLVKDIAKLLGHDYVDGAAGTF